MKNIWTRDDVRKLQETTPSLQQEVIYLYEWARTCRSYRTISKNDPRLVLDLRCYPHPAIQQELIWNALAVILCHDYYWENVYKYHLVYYPNFLAFLLRNHPSGIPSLRMLREEDIAAFAAEYPTVTHRKNAQRFLVRCRYELRTYFDEKTLFERDVWEIGCFHLPDYRINRNCVMREFSFRDIPSEHNKRLVKRFVEYKLLHTEIAKNTIHSHLQHLKHIVRFLGDCPVEKITPNVMERFLQTMTPASDSANQHLYSLLDFFETGITLGLWTNAPFPIHPFVRPRTYQLRAHRISDFVLQQIFEHLDALPHTVALLFLVLYYTGMRFTEACTIKVNCLHQNQGNYIIRFYQTKMRKECLNPIPQHLYELLLEQQRKLLKSSPDGIWLLPNQNGEPYKSYGFRKQMNRIIEAYHIVEADGQLFHFHSHALRHTFAMRLIQNDIPFATVQKLLHHASPEMTLCYAKIDEATRKKRYLDFCQKIRPRQKPLSGQEKEIDDDMRWMHHVMHQILPNGFCCLPTELGVCPHANACLFCESFYTTKEFLPVLRYQREKICMLERMQGDVPPMMAKAKQRLDELIRPLEGVEEDDAGNG